MDLNQLFLVNEDLLTEILLRLPAKSLIRFKSVCRKWLALISSDYFCRNHTLRRPKLQPSLLLQTEYSPSTLFYFHTTGGQMTPYSLPHHHHHIVGGRNGLMLLQSKHQQNNYYVYNPTTRQSRKITLSENVKLYPHVLGEGIYLAFDPSKSPHYKIVYHMIALGSGYCYYCYEVYDSQSHAWELYRDPYAIHWSISSIGYCYFDIDTKKLKALVWPQARQGMLVVARRLQESNGRVFHLELMKGGDGHGSVAVYERSCSKWVLKHYDPFPTERDACTTFSTKLTSIFLI